MKTQQENVEKNTKKIKNKRTSREKKELWTVLAILATVMLLAIVGLGIHGNAINIHKFTGSGRSQEKDDRDDARNILYGTGIICIGVIGVYIYKRSKKNKNKRKQLEKKYLEQQKLEEARERVRQARMLETLESGRAEIEKRRRERVLMSGRDEKSYDYSTDDESDELSRQEYMERRRKEYQYYMQQESDDLSDGKSILSDDYKEKNMTSVISGLLKNKKFLIAAATVVVAVIAAVILIILI